MGPYYDFYRGGWQFDFDFSIAKEFFQTTITHGKHQLFGKALGWHTNQLAGLAMPIFEMVGSAALSGTFEFAKFKDRYVAFSSFCRCLVSHSSRVLMLCSLLQALSTRTIYEHRSLSRALAKPGGAQCRACVEYWLAQEVTLQAVTACSKPELTYLDGRAIVEMISEYRNLEFFTTW